ncbi:hypothetical protein RU07_09010 [Agrobacterium tumefaciens]|uniref:Glycosyltransferase family 8 protein n=1 Tax=Agrobacterium tumefaciens TaxID=358 RepID=A0A0D0KWC6_AGRTU|nr:hypothetical protein RU07_09010 [Agrobacterium tumefaciens]
MPEYENEFLGHDVYIVTVIDRGFVELAGVMLKSLVANGEVENYKLVVVCDDLRLRDKDKLRECARPYTIDFKDLTASEIAKISFLPTNSNWSRAIYARLLLPELLNVAHGRILYLDADILILRSLRSLLSINLQQFPVAACGGVSTDVALRLELDASTKTLNSGVLLVDVENWRRDRVSEKCIATALEKTSLLKFFDQDALNIALSGRFLPLGSEWNNPGQGDLSQVAVLHFTHEKPNSVQCRHPAKHLYLQYRKATPWANKPLQSVWYKRMKRIRYSIKRRLRLL